MEEYSSSSSIITNLSKNPNEEKGSNSKQSVPTYYPSLHSIRKAPSKQRNKKPVSRLPSNSPRIYKVDPINFRDLVQNLTTSPELLQTRRLHSIAPSPLQVDTTHSLFNKTSINKIPKTEQVQPKPSLSAMYKEFSQELDQTNKAQMNNKGSSDNKMASSFLGFNLSPSSYNWCSFPLLSPDTCSFLEQSTLL